MCMPLLDLFPSECKNMLKKTENVRFTSITWEGGTFSLVPARLTNPDHVPRESLPHF